MIAQPQFRAFSTLVRHLFIPRLCAASECRYRKHKRSQLSPVTIKRHSTSLIHSEPDLPLGIVGYGPEVNGSLETPETYVLNRTGRKNLASQGCNSKM